MTFEAGEQALTAETGSFVQIPPGLSHSFSARGGGPTRFLNIHTPGRGFGAFLRGLEAGLPPGRAVEEAGFDQVSSPEK